KRTLRRARVPQADLPFAELLAANRRALPPRLRALARMLVEGFDAADADYASSVATLEEWQGQSAADAPTFRPLGGYGELLTVLRTALEAHTAELRLGAVVDEVRWSAGRVLAAGGAAGRRFEVAARRAVITLPLGVLQAGVDARG